ncbi:Inhibitor of nuclear factor kappa-B kinase subunit beta, partial [Lemmus lemmus]
VAEAHALCTRLESTLQDTVKEQDHSFTVTTLRDPSLPAPFLSPFLSVAKEERRESHLVSALAQQSLTTVSYIFKFFVIVSYLEMPCASVSLILMRINPSEVAAVFPEAPSLSLGPLQSICLC